MTTSAQYAARLAWFDDLESSRFAQCRYRLYDGSGYCCMGVGEVSIGHEFYLDDDHGWAIPVGDFPESHVFTPHAMETLGFVTDTPFLHSGPFRGQSLAALNDGYGLTFPEIAAQLRLQDRDWDGSFRQEFEK